MIHERKKLVYYSEADHFFDVLLAIVPEDDLSQADHSSVDC